MSIFKGIAILIGICLVIAIAAIAIGVGFGIVVISPSGEISVPALGDLSVAAEPLPLDPNDPVIGAYRSGDDTTVCRFYSNGTYILQNLVHPVVSFGDWKNYGSGHYSLYLTLTQSGGKVAYANTLGPVMELDLKDGALASRGSGDRFVRISGNPGEAVQGHTYATASPGTPINRQVGVEVKRVGPDSIYVKVLSGKDVGSLVSLRVIASGKEAVQTGGKISPQIGATAYYGVSENSYVTVVAEFYDYTRYTLWSGMI